MGRQRTGGFLKPGKLIRASKADKQIIVVGTDKKTSTWCIATNRDRITRLHSCGHPENLVAKQAELALLNSISSGPGDIRFSANYVTSSGPAPQFDTTFSQR